MIFRVLNYIRSKRKYMCFQKNAILKGEKYIFGLKSGISLEDGSKRENIILEDNVWIYGNLQSQNGGIIHMGYCSKIGSGCKIQSVNSVEIGDYTAIADNVFISDNNNHPVSPSFRLYMRKTAENDDSRKWKHSANAPIVIGKNCWIGQNVRIQKGVSIGDNSVIAANSIVTKDIPANCIAGGNPAKILKADIDKIEAPTSCIGYNESIK